MSLEFEKGNNSSVMEDLISKTIEKIFISKDKQILVFQCKEGYEAYELNNGCCSNGWIEHLKFHYSLGKVIDVYEIELGEVLPSIQEKDYLYGIKITTNSDVFNGEIFIEFRNSSNGYYGISIEKINNLDLIDFNDLIELEDDF